MKPIADLARKSDWQVAAREVCRGERSLEPLRRSLLDPAHGLKAPQALRVQQRAGYLLLHVHWRCPERLDELLPELLGLVEPGGPRTHASIARQVFSVFQDRPLPECLAGRCFAAAVATFADRGAPTAARARALDAAANVARQFAGLWPELAALAADVPPDEPPGVRSIAGRVALEAARNL